MANRYESQTFIPDWQVVLSQWGTDKMGGYVKALEFIQKHEVEFGKLNDEIIQFWESCKQPDWQYRCKIQFKNRMEKYLQSKISYPFQLVITGSTISGVATANSDIDICMCAPKILGDVQLDPHDMKKRIRTILRRCKQYLDEIADELGLTSIDYVDAMVPILKLNGAITDSETGNRFEIDADLSISNDIFVSGLHNSHLVRGYTRVDERFAPLVVFIKKWASGAGVKDPQHRRFNSYAITLLVIHFLQCAMPNPVLPNLQGIYPGFYAIAHDNFPDTVDVEQDLPEPLPDLPRLPKNRLLVSHLFYLFLVYYSSIDLRNLVIRVKCGRICHRLRRDEKGSEEDAVAPPDKYKHSQIFIEDPIDDHNPGRTVDDWEAVRGCFEDTAYTFQRVDDRYDMYLFPDIDDLLY